MASRRRRRVVAPAASTLCFAAMVRAQCPASCRPGAGQGCFPPRCGPKCCAYWSRKKHVSIEQTVANASMPSWTRNCPRTADSATGCAALWPTRRHQWNASSSAASAADDPPVVLISLFKNVRVDQLLRFLEYHLLLGVDRAVLVDNSCGAHADASRVALAPYVAAGLVAHHVEFVCSELRSMMFMHNFRGGSSMARQLSGMRSVPRGAFIVSLDDDEYLVLADSGKTLHDLRRELVNSRVCALTLTWRVFGSSGHRCQPEGPLLRRFMRRALTEPEAADHDARRHQHASAAARHEARKRHLNTPYGGKPMYIYDSATSPMCGTHWCDECPTGLHNCALPQGAGAGCEKRYNLTSVRFWINHYAFQSEEHWEAKKLRGRTNLLPSRQGAVPKSYERLFDPTALALLQRRIEAVAQPPLRECLTNLFADGGSAG